MAIGWLLASPERDRALRFMRNPYVIVSLLVLGFAAHTTGDLLIGRWSVRYWQSLAIPLMTLGLALLVLPLLLKPPSRIDVSLPVRALTTVGVMSYALLIINDPMRLVASQLRLEQVPSAVWWTFLVAVYVPASVALAWPLSHALGLMPKKPARPAESRPIARPAVAPSAELEPAAP